MLEYVVREFDKSNPNYVKSPEANAAFISAVQYHLLNRLQAQGHLFLNEAYDALGLPRTPEGAVIGWLWEADTSTVPFEWVENENIYASFTLRFKTDGLMFHKI